MEALTVVPEPEPVPEPLPAAEGEEPAPAAEEPVQPEPILPTEAAVLEKLMADGVLSKEGIQEALIVKHMGDAHFSKDPLYAPAAAE